MKLSNHQKRVLSSIFALECRYQWSWWHRDAIGEVVGSGGFHGTIQRRTMSILKAAGLVQTQRSSWSAEVAEHVRCNCACWHWGLTEAGRAKAKNLDVRWPEEAVKRLERCKIHVCCSFRDEDEDPPGWDGWGDDDDDGDPPPAPKPLEPAYA